VPLSNSAVIPPPRFGLAARLLVAVALLAIETLLISGLIQSPALDHLTGAAKLTHDLQHWVFRFAIAYAGSFAILLYLRGNIAGIPAIAAATPVRIPWLLLHVALLAPFALLSWLLYRGGALPFALLNLSWHACGLAAAAAHLDGCSEANGGASPLFLGAGLRRHAGIQIVPVAVGSGGRAHLSARRRGGATADSVAAR
jgi:hypothetical protein